MKRLLSLFVVVGALVMLPPASAVAQDVLAAQIEKKATLVDDGQAVLVTVTVTCASSSPLLEALLYVVQDGNTSQFAGLPVVCDGIQRTVTVRVNALDTPFHVGKARASGYVLLTNGKSISFTAKIKIRD